MSAKFNFKGLFLGQTGSGKSTGAITYPLKPGERILMLDYDGRGDALEQNFDFIDRVTFEPVPLASIKGKMLEQQKMRIATGGPVSFIEKTEYTQAWLTSTYRKALKDDPKAPFPYALIMMDGLGALSYGALVLAMSVPRFDDVLKEASWQNKDKTMWEETPELGHYGAAGFRLKKVIMNMLTLPCSHIMTAHPTSDKDALTQQIFWGVGAHGKQTRENICGMYNEVYLCECAKGKYLWHTKAKGRWDFLKSSMNLFGKLWKDPIEINWDKPGPRGLEHLINLVQAKVQNQAQTKERRT